ncbi:MAG: HAMP domain-containing sensor histidine kinase [Calothrix sp. MO_167.B42]|nr:HAMP domain-containing sensor histidine kinase [Calothrix sp. MO_167.B42]
MEETRKVLVVGSDKQDYGALCRILNQTSIPVEVSLVDGEKKGNSLGAFSQVALYDCIFLNHHLPQDNALATVEQLQSLGIKIPIIVIINEDNGQDATQIIASSGVEYISKSDLSSTTLARILRLCIRLGDAEKRVAQMMQKLQASNESLKRQKRELVAQKQLLRLQHLKLLEASQLKSQFLTTISHELRTPMNAVIGFAQVLLRPNFHALTLQQTDIVERILNNGKHLLMLLNELLEFSGLESGDITPKPEVFDLSQCIETTVAEVRSLADEKHLPIIVRNQLQNHVIFNDTKKMKQVLTNLLSNAIKFTESGYICVEVEELSENRVAISVQDTGIGIATKDINSIFEPFWQVDQTTSRKYGGTGLGLAIAHSLIQIMCGKITVNSQLGEGSIFRVELPRQVSSSYSHHIKDVCPGTVAHSGKRRMLL